jgi:hypothetical protein
MGGSIMPFTNNRRYYVFGFIGFIIVASLIGWGALNAPNPSAKIKESQTITVTIEKNVGIDLITYENLDNPGEIKTLSIIDLPYSFNCSRGDTLSFNFTARSGYTTNTLDFSPTGRSSHDNPLFIDSSDPLYCYNNRIDVTPTFISMRVSPTSSPIPTPTPHPTPTPINTQAPFS